MANRSARRPCGSSPRRKGAATADPLRRHAPYLVAAALLLSACGGPGAERAADGWPAGGPRAGSALSGSLAAGETHRHPLDLAAGTYLRLAVEQQDADLAVVLVAPDGREVVADEPFERSGAELLPALATVGGRHEIVVANSESVQAGGYELRVEALRPASAADRANADAYAVHREARRLRDAEPSRALTLWRQAAGEWRRLGEAALEARALARLGGLHCRLGEVEPAAGAYRRSAAAFERGGEPRLAAFALNNAALCRFDNGQREAALAGFEGVIARTEALGEPTVEALARHGAGRVHREWGEVQEALDQYERARRLMPATYSQRPTLLGDLGVLHARFLGDRDAGSALIAEARDGYTEAGKRAVAHNQLAQLAFEAGRFAAARGDLEAALALQDGASCARGVTLARLALVDAAQDQGEASRRRVAEATGLIAGERCRRDAATVHRLAGQAAERLGDPAAAERAYRRCVELHGERGDRVGRAVCLAGSARARRALGDPAAALAAGEEALALLEGTRPTVLRTDLRIGFASELQEPFDAVVGALVDLGRDEQAWVTAERARARALVDLLSEAAAGLRGRADAGLLAEERRLRRRLNQLETERAAADDATARHLAEQIDGVIVELETVRGEMRRGTPVAALAAHPSGEELRRQLDGDRLLLEYRLGDRESYLWAVTRERVVAHRLPPRGELEPLAERLARRQASRRRAAGEAEGCELARRLLAPVAAELGERPLVLVPDGALETISFAALPDPAAGCGQPLALRHAVSYLPSLATLAEQRRRFASRPPAERWLAVVADPIYSASDTRLGSAVRGGEDEEREWSRLRFTRHEAEAIAALLPGAFTAYDAEASRATVLGGALAGSRVVHFATHGLLAAGQPLRSRLVLSRFDGRGRPVAGASDLSALEIYDLDLDAELVVLSACETAAGSLRRGEGLVAGLPRAFLYAGAERVVVSLWPVDDHRTRDLMVLFYRRLVLDGLAPDAALREAQTEMWRRDPSPHGWAAFVLQGDPAPLPPFAP